MSDEEKALAKNEDSSSLSDFADSIDTSRVVTRANCRLCNHPLREQAEAMYAESSNAKKVHRWLVSQGLNDIHYNSVYNHLTRHFMQPILDERIKDYASDLKRYAQLQEAQEEKIRRHIGMIERRILLIEANTDEENIDSQRKTGETVAKLMDQIHKWEEKLAELDGAKEPVRIVLHKFNDIVRIKIDDIQDPAARLVLQEIIDEFAQEVQEIQ